jgi:hypothetical protein
MSCACNEQALCLQQGDDYLFAGKPVAISGAGMAWPLVSDIAEIKCLITRCAGCEFQGAPELIKIFTGVALASALAAYPNKLRIELTAAETLSLGQTLRGYTYRVIAKLTSSGESKTIVNAALSVGGDCVRCDC